MNPVRLSCAAIAVVVGAEPVFVGHYVAIWLDWGADIVAANFRRVREIR